MMTFSFSGQKTYLASMIRAIGLSTVLATSFVNTALAETVPATQTTSYHIPASDLGNVLATFATQSGVVLAFDTDLTRGLKSDGLKGTYSITQGFEQLLKGTNLQLQKRADGSLTLEKIQAKPQPVQARDMGQLKTIDVTASSSANRDSNVTQLPVITVNAEQNGSAEEGYLMKKVNTLGVWGDLSLQDTPYSMSILSSDFLENSATNSTYEIINKNPVITPGANGIESEDSFVATIRGFGQSSGVLLDGMKFPNSTISFGTSLSEVDRVEVISGLTGFLYGQGNVGGTVNYAIKYPTLQPFTKVSLGNNGGENYLISADTSQNITDQLSVRLNTKYQDGDTAINDQKNKEKLIGISLDYQPIGDLKLQAYYSHLEKSTINKPDWYMSTGKRLDASDINTENLYSSKYSNTDVKSDKLELKAQYNFLENFSLRAAYIYQNATKDSVYSAVNMTNPENGGAFLSGIGNRNIINNGVYAYLDSNFKTGFIDHILTFGVNVGTRKTKNPASTTRRRLTGVTDINQFNNWEGVFVADPNTNRHVTEDKISTNIIIGDNITFNDHWSALIGANLSTLDFKNYNATTGLKTGEYDEKALTPTFSLLYKPFADLTTYVTYMESLEQGSVIDNAFDENDGKIFEPVISKQYEIGGKWNINQKLLLSTALFRIERASTISETFADNGNGKTQRTTQDGMQINQGFEVLFTGKATDHLALMGGITLLDTELEKQSSANKALEGNKAGNVPKNYAKIYAEYQLPIEPKIFLNGGLYYTGKRWTSTQNIENLPSYTTADIGARYETKIQGYDTIFRIYGTNITNERYWVNQYQISNPRSIAFSLNIKY